MDPLQEPESSAVGKANVPGAPPMPKPWYASPWVFLALIALFLVAVVFVTRELRRDAVPAGSAPVPVDTTVRR